MRTEIETPTTPNFIRVRLGSGKVVQISRLPISDFKEEELREIGKKWTEDLIASARKRRTNTL